MKNKNPKNSSMSKSRSIRKKRENPHETLALANARVCIGILVLAGAVVLGSFGTGVAQMYGIDIDQVQQPPSPLHVQASIDQALQSGSVDGRRLYDRAAMYNFYAGRSFEPYWMSNTGPYSKAHEFLAVLEKSWMHGLNPETYHTQHMRELVQGTSFLKKTELELLLSDAFVRYARDLSGIRVDPAGLNTDPKSWRQPLSAGEAFMHLNGKGTMSRILRDVEPQGRTYKMLQKELVRLSEQPEEDYAGVLPIEFDGLLRPGERHARVPDIRTRLGVKQHTNDALLYDDRLTAAVIKFQREYDLQDDGVIGSQTLQIMNRTNKKRMEQVVANLERLRWVEETRPSRYVVVNIPAATLWAVDQGRVDFEMPVIVGKPVRPTQTFITEIQGVRFNPDWTIPPTIKRFDVLPKVKEDPNYLNQKGIQLIKGHGKNAITIDPYAVDWSGISSSGLNSMRMVQGPGENNPLGRVRVLMPNIYNIYLHDTNHPEYFDEPARAVSSGCIRMKYPEKMAQFIMEYEAGWRDAEMEEIFETKEKTDIEIAHKMPVYVLYYTVWTDSRGRVVYGTDIYNQDSKLITKLSNIDGFYIPRHNKDNMSSSGRVRHFAVNQ